MHKIIAQSVKDLIERNIKQNYKQNYNPMRKGASKVGVNL